MACRPAAWPSRSPGFNEAGARIPRIYGVHFDAKLDAEAASMRPGQEYPGYAAYLSCSFWQGLLASMRPGQEYPGYLAHSADHVVVIVASMRPGQEYPGYPVIPSPNVALSVCFNEAGARIPRISCGRQRKSTLLPCFNEAGARIPRIFRAITDREGVQPQLQ